MTTPADQLLGLNVYFMAGQVAANAQQLPKHLRLTVNIGAVIYTGTDLQQVVQVANQTVFTLFNNTVTAAEAAADYASI